MPSLQKLKLPSGKELLRRSEAAFPSRELLVDGANSDVAKGTRAISMVISDKTKSTRSSKGASIPLVPDGIVLPSMPGVSCKQSEYPMGAALTEKEAFDRGITVQPYIETWCGRVAQIAVYVQMFTHGVPEEAITSVLRDTGLIEKTHFVRKSVARVSERPMLLVLDRDIKYDLDRIYVGKNPDAVCLAVLRFSPATRNELTVMEVSYDFFDAARNMAYEGYTVLVPKLK